jgi:hypothetical protein
LNLLPSVTNVLRILAKPALESWKSEQIALAIATAPRIQGEEIDVFIRRVLQNEQQQNEERDVAAKRGTAIHRCLEQLFSGESDPNDPMLPYVKPAYEALMEDCDEVIATEKVLVGDGYAGTADLITKSKETGRYQLWDFKSTKRIPEQPYPEHRLQCSAYGGALATLGVASLYAIDVGNVYVSSVDIGQYDIAPHGPAWMDTYRNGFRPVLEVWKWMHNF